MKKFYLAFEIGIMQKSVYPLLGPTTIGRAEDNTITIPDPMTSRNHARVVFADDAWVVEDLGSANGIIVGDQRVERAVLDNGDIFQIGGITFRYVEKEASEPSEQLFETVEVMAAATGEYDVQLGEAKENEKVEDTKPWSLRLQDAVAAIPFFSPLEEDARKELADSATLHVFNGGEMIIREGEPGRSIYVILDGRIRVFSRDHHGEELELAILETSQFFGETSFLTGKPRLCSVAALDTSVVVELSYTSMRKVAEEHPTVKEVLFKFHRDRKASTAKKRAEVGKDLQRRDPRTREKVPVRLVVPPPKTSTGEEKTRSWQAVSMNISDSGIVARVPGASQDAFHIEGEVRLEIGLPGTWGAVSTLGTVRRVKPALTDQKMILVGVDYVGMAEADAKKLNEFLYGETH